MMAFVVCLLYVLAMSKLSISGSSAVVMSVQERPAYPAITPAFDRVRRGSVMRVFGRLHQIPTNQGHCPIVVRSSALAPESLCHFL